MEALTVLFTLLEDCLNHLIKLKNKIVLGGDYNTHFNASSSDETVCLVTLLESYGLYVMSTEPTRGKSCHDVWDYEVRVTDPDVSDHCALTMNVLLPEVNIINTVLWHDNHTFYFMNINNDECIQNFRCELGSLNLMQPSIRLLCEEDSFNKFFFTFKEIFDSHFPL